MLGVHHAYLRFFAATHVACWLMWAASVVVTAALAQRRVEHSYRHPTFRAATWNREVSFPHFVAVLQVDGLNLECECDATLIASTLKPSVVLWWNTQLVSTTGFLAQETAERVQILSEEVSGLEFTPGFGFTSEEEIDPFTSQTLSVAALGAGGFEEQEVCPDTALELDLATRDQWQASNDCFRQNPGLLETIPYQVTDLYPHPTLTASKTIKRTIDPGYGLKEIQQTLDLTREGYANCSCQLVVNDDNGAQRTYRWSTIKSKGLTTKTPDEDTEEVLTAKYNFEETFREWRDGTFNDLPGPIRVKDLIVSALKREAAEDGDFCATDGEFMSSALHLYQGFSTLRSKCEDATSTQPPQATNRPRATNRPSLAASERKATGLSIGAVASLACAGVVVLAAGAYFKYSSR